MTITAALVKELRQRTGVGMMECKKALQEAGGDLDSAITIMRKSGQAKAAKKGDRVAAEGVVVLRKSQDNKRAVMLEVNCETDFAARDENFLEFVDKVALKSLEAKLTSIERIGDLVFDDGKSIVELREDLVAKIGENINVRRLNFMEFDTDANISSYVHGNGRIGVMVALSSDNSDLGKDIAMHIAATNPVAMTEEEFPASILEKEKEIFLAQLQDSGKPSEMLEKIVSGKIKKFVSESVLLKQPFVKDPDMTIEALLQKQNTNILGFIRFEVGEGVEKKEVDFAAEVKAQAEASTK